MLAYNVNIIILAAVLSLGTGEAAYIQACNEGYFCGGDVLHKIQMSQLFNDSKTFVDMPLKVNYTSNIEKELLRKQTKNQLRDVVNKYFYPAGYHELESYNNTDWVENPKLLDAIKNSEYREWAKHLCAVWKKLVRSINTNVETNSNRHSLIYLKNSFVVPGGRFREMYYWDTYWAVEGMCQCEMYNTTKNMLENFIKLVEKFGFVPNGGRKYYENRSQPPFLTLMVHKYWTYTNDDEFIRKHIKILVKEYDFWMKERSITLGPEHDPKRSNKSYTFNLYQSMMGYPRPESYKEDIKTMLDAGYEDNRTAQKELYSHIASAAESGWDFSSRWFRDGKNISTIQTRNIIPVDLNSILCLVEYSLGILFQDVLSDSAQSDHYGTLAETRRKQIQEFFWDESYGLWLDYDIRTKQLNRKYYASSFYPLWNQVKGQLYLNQTIKNRAFKKFKELKLFSYIGGLPTSLVASGEQWDFPNSWPPLQYIAVHGLNKVNQDQLNDEAKKTARNLAKKFLETAFRSWKVTGHMFEKYDVRLSGKAGYGGEYDVQEGFGWTNGVVLNFLATYGHNLNAPTFTSGCVLNEPIILVTFIVIFYMFC